MANAQTIKKFYSTAASRDFARNFSFRVDDIVDRGQSVINAEDLVYVTTAALPGRSISVTTQPYMGLEFQIPGSAKYTNSGGYQMTFRADGSNIIRSLFERWTFLTFDDETSTGTYRIYENSSITLTQLDQDLNPLPEKYKLHGIFPVTVGDLSYDMTGNGDPITLDVTFAYQFWRKTT
jgi:hypothetical protein